MKRLVIRSESYANVDVTVAVDLPKPILLGRLSNYVQATRLDVVLIVYPDVYYCTIRATGLRANKHGELYKKSTPGSAVVHEDDIPEKIMQAVFKEAQRMVDSTGPAVSRFFEARVKETEKKAK